MNAEICTVLNAMNFLLYVQTVVNEHFDRMFYNYKIRILLCNGVKIRTVLCNVQE